MKVGRPSKGEREKLATRVDLDTADAVQYEADRCGLSVSEWLDAALRHVLTGSPMPKPKGEK